MWDKDSNQLLLEGESDDGLYRLPMDSEARQMEVIIAEKAYVELWHGRMGHLNSRYFVNLVNALSNYNRVYFLQWKYEISDIFVHFNNMVEKQTDRDIKSMQSDNNREFLALGKWFK